MSRPGAALGEEALIAVARRCAGRAERAVARPADGERPLAVVVVGDVVDLALVGALERLVGADAGEVDDAVGSARAVTAVVRVALEHGAPGSLRADVVRAGRRQRLRAAACGRRRPDRHRAEQRHGEARGQVAGGAHQADGEPVAVGRQAADVARAAGVVVGGAGDVADHATSRSTPCRAAARASARAWRGTSRPSAARPDGGENRYPVADPERVGPAVGRHGGRRGGDLRHEPAPLGAGSVRVGEQPRARGVAQLAPHPVRARWRGRRRRRPAAPRPAARRPCRPAARVEGAGALPSTAGRRSPRPRPGSRPCRSCDEPPSPPSRNSERPTPVEAHSRPASQDSTSGPGRAGVVPATARSSALSLKTTSSGTTASQAKPPPTARSAAKPWIRLRATTSPVDGIDLDDAAVLAADGPDRAVGGAHGGHLDRRRHSRAHAPGPSGRRAAPPGRGRATATAEPTASGPRVLGSGPDPERPLHAPAAAADQSDPRPGSLGHPQPARARGDAAAGEREPGRGRHLAAAGVDPDHAASIVEQHPRGPPGRRHLVGPARKRYPADEAAAARVDGGEHVGPEPQLGPGGRVVRAAAHQHGRRCHAGEHPCRGEHAPACGAVRGAAAPRRAGPRARRERARRRSRGARPAPSTSAAATTSSRAGGSSGRRALGLGGGSLRCA